MTFKPGELTEISKCGGNTTQTSAKESCIQEKPEKNSQFDLAAGANPGDTPPLSREEAIQISIDRGIFNSEDEIITLEEDAKRLTPPSTDPHNTFSPS